MGKASSNKKVARAASTGGGRTSRGRTPWGWYSALSMIAVLGLLGVVVSRDDLSTEVEHPALGEHVHAAYGVYICDNFMPPLGDRHGDRLGIHTHNDGLIHIHPTSSSAAGRRATLEKFLEETDLELSEDELRYPGQQVHKNGEKCGDNEAEVRVEKWDAIADETSERVVGDPADLRLREGQVITIAFVAKGTTPPKPPSVAELPNPRDLAPQPAPDGSSTTLPPGVTVPTTPPATTPDAPPATTPTSTP